MSFKFKQIGKFEARFDTGLAHELVMTDEKQKVEDPMTLSLKINLLVITAAGGLNFTQLSVKKNLP
jgi:hypothetical protein